VLISVIPYILLSIPFITTPSYIENIFVNSSGYLNNVFILLYILFLLILIKIKNINQENKNLLFKSSYIILGLFLVTTQFHPQFIVWILPFIYVLLFNNDSHNKVMLYILLMISYFIYINYLGKNSMWILFLPLDNTITNFPSLPAIFNKYIKFVNFFRIIDFSKIIFNIILIYIFFLKIKKNET
jgi:hypothetical protein